MTPSAAAVFTGGEVPEQNDLVIALMGTTGSGKSSFIKLCTDRDVVVGHDLESCTRDVQTYSFKHPSYPSFRVFLVDTPGFDDTHKSDSEILRTLTAWLTATFLNGIKLSGIVYLHRINQPRLQGSARRNVKLFEDLYGDNAFRNVILVTTMWDITEKGLAEEREKQLRSKREYWGYMADKGSEIFRHYNSKGSALQVVEHLIKKNSRVVLNVQDEIVNNNQPLDKTTVGQGVLEILAEQTDKFTKELKSVESDLTQALQKKDEEMAQLMRELRMEHKRDLDRVLDSQRELQATMQQIHETKYAELEQQLHQKTYQQTPRPTGVDHLDSSSTNSVSTTSTSSSPRELTATPMDEPSSSQILGCHFVLQADIRVNDYLSYKRFGGPIMSLDGPFAIFPIYDRPRPNTHLEEVRVFDLRSYDIHKVICRRHIEFLHMKEVENSIRRPFWWHLETEHVVHSYTSDCLILKSRSYRKEWSETHIYPFESHPSLPPGGVRDDSVDEIYWSPNLQVQINTRERVMTKEGKNWSVSVRDNQIHCYKFTPDSKFLVIVTDDKELQFWRTDDASLHGEYPMDCSGTVTLSAISGNSEWITVRSHTVIDETSSWKTNLWKITDGGAEYVSSINHDKMPYCSLSYDGELFAEGLLDSSIPGYTALKMWDVRTGKELTANIKPRRSWRGFIFFPRDDRIVFWDDRYCRVYKYTVTKD